MVSTRTELQKRTKIQHAWGQGDDSPDSEALPDPVLIFSVKNTKRSSVTVNDDTSNILEHLVMQQIREVFDACDERAPN